MQSAFKMKKIENTSKYTFRERLIVFLFENSKNIYRITFKKNKKAWDTSLEKLETYNHETLAKDLSLFLKENNFKLEEKFESHDIYHVLTQYPTTVKGEICLSFFNIGTGKKSIYTVGVAFIGLFIMLENYKLFIKAYKRGKTAKNYTKWNFEFLLNEKTENLRKLLFNKINNENIIII